MTENQDYLDYIYNPYASAINNLTGYLLIDQEIVSFEGALYEFKIYYIDVTTQKYTSIQKIIKNQSDISNYINELYSNSNYNSDTKSIQNIEVKPLNKLCNLQRGMFGTFAKSHSSSNNLSNIIVKDNSGNTLTNFVIPINVNNYNQNGFRIPLDPSATSHINNKTYAFLSNTTNNKTLVYSASFTPTSYMDVKDVEKDKDSHTPITIQNYDNGVFTYGMIINSDISGGNFGKGLCVEFQIDYRNKINKVDQRITIYDSSNPSVKWTQIFGSSNTEDVAYNQYLNNESENNICVILKTNAVNTVESMILLINGKTFQFGEKTDHYDKNKIVSFSYTANNSTKDIKLNGIDLISLGITLQLEKYFGIYTNRYNYLNVNNLSAVSINNYNSLLPPKEFINIISDINQNGVLGTKNKAYANAVAHEESVHSNKNIVYNSYSDSGVAREIMLFDLTYNSSPIESPQLLKNDINTYPTTITPDGKVIDKKILKIIPAISVTASDVIGDNYNARFAIINSWDGIVPLMDSTQGSSSQSSIIKLKGKIISPDNKQDLMVQFNERVGTQDAVIQTSWVQSEEDGWSILKNMASMAKMKDVSSSVTTVFNPLIQICDMISINGLQSDLRICVKVNNSMGLNTGKTTLVLNGVPT